MGDHSQYIHDNPVALLSKYLTTGISKNDNSLHQASKLFVEVEKYIKELEEQNKMLRSKLS